MEPSGFLNGPQVTANLIIPSWNVHGVKAKLEKCYVQDLLLKFDIIGLYEVKTELSVNFPG